MIMKAIYLLIVLNLFCLKLYSQTTGYIPFNKPVSPTAFQFLKYDELPIDEYSGLAEISIPIYQIETDKIKIPIALSYHGGGIRVAEEASWVGLGWDLQMGNIVQIVNDQDDLDNTGAIHKVLPDYYNFYYPYNFCERNPIPIVKNPNPPDCYFPSTGIDQTHPRSSYITFTDYYFPVDGNYNTRNPDFFNANYPGQIDLIDSEPDIFKANFFGHTFTFIIDIKTGYINILDKKGYKVSLVSLPNNTKGIKVISPDGTIFEFNEITESKIVNSATKVRFSVYMNGRETVASRIFQISKITDINGEEITFNWIKTQNIKVLPGFNQTYKNMKTGSVSATPEPFYGRLEFAEIENCEWQYACSGGIAGLNPNSTLTDLGFNYSNIQEIKSYLSSITFPSGSITFMTSPRLDIVNDLKLDNIKVQNNNQKLIKSISFDYSYLVGHNNGMSYDKETDYIIYHGKTSTELSNRLKLNSINLDRESKYTFVYNETQLPLKSSYAVDYWGFYNGKISNTSLIPNPKVFNDALTDNGNDRASYLEFAKAGSLEKIIFPTKGERYFIYELNTFSNPTTPFITVGNGLRVKETGTTDENEKFKIESYSYEGGKLITPLSLFINDGFSQNSRKSFPNEHGLLSHIDYMLFIDAWLINSSNFYTSSYTGSGNNVGYDKVTKVLLGNNNLTSGKIIDYYYNSFDVVDQRSNRPSNMILPARKDEGQFINGLKYKSEIFKDGNNSPVKVIDYEYYPFAISKVFYGAKQSYDHYFAECGGMGTIEYYQFEKDLVGFYPIYSGNCLLKRETITDYPTLGVPLAKNTWYSYDYQYNNIAEIKTDRSDGNSDSQEFYYPYDPYTQVLPPDQYLSDLRAANRLNHPIKIDKSIYLKYTGIRKWQSVIKEEYENFGNLLLLKKNTEFTPAALPYLPSGENTTIIDNYDSFGNIRQYHKKDNVLKTILWGYNSQYPVAEIVGSDYATVSTIITNQSLLDNPANDTSLRDYLHTLRTSLPNAMVTTYTYIPLIGMTSSTDPKGMTTFYEYDDFQRLKSIKDQKGNIIKSYDYHYKR